MEIINLNANTIMTIGKYKDMKYGDIPASYYYQLKAVQKKNADIPLMDPLQMYINYKDGIQTYSKQIIQPIVKQPTIAQKTKGNIFLQMKTCKLTV